MTDLFERAWPVDDAVAGVAVVHGLAEHSGRYDYVARALNAAGFAAYGIDLRGHGNSVGFPGDMGDDPSVIVDDVVAFCTRVYARHPKTFLLAHSMGTLFSIPAAAQAGTEILDGLILSGTATVPGQAVLEAMGTGEGLPPDAISRDEAIVEAYKQDPLVFYDRVPQELMLMLPQAMERVAASISMITMPVLLLHGTDDKLCALEGAQNVHTRLVGTDKTLKAYPGLYHEVLNEPERDDVIADVVGWLQAH